MSGARSPLVEPPSSASAAAGRGASSQHPSQRQSSHRASSPPSAAANNNNTNSSSATSNCSRSLSRSGSGTRSPPTTPNSTSSNHNHPHHHLSKASQGSDVSSPDLTRGSPSTNHHHRPGSNSASSSGGPPCVGPCCPPPSGQQPGNPLLPSPRPGFPFPPGHPADPAACDPHLLNLFRLGGGGPGALPFGLFPPPPGAPGSGPPDLRNGPHPPDASLLPGLRPDQPLNSAFYPPPGAPFNMKENENLWLNTFPYASMFYPPFDGNPALAGYPFGPNGCGMDMGAARRKNATRETTATLKAWLNEHRKNPYPTKGEKIMLAIITRMTLTQVSTWFANARRRLKKENKMTWSPRNRCDDDDDDDDDSNDASNQGGGKSGKDKDDDDDDDDINVDVESDSNPEPNPLLANSSAFMEKLKAGLPLGGHLPPTHPLFHPQAHHHASHPHPYARPFSNGIDSFAAFKGPSAFMPAHMKSVNNGPSSHMPNWPPPPHPHPQPPSSLASTTSNSPVSGTGNSQPPSTGHKPRIWSIVDTVKSDAGNTPTTTSSPHHSAPPPPPHSLASSLNASTNPLSNPITSPFCRPPPGMGSPFGPGLTSQPLGMGPIGTSRHLARNGTSPR